MRKTLLIIAVIAILSGCGMNSSKDEKLTCTSDNTVGDFTSNTTYVIDYKGDDVKKLTVTYDYRDNHVDGVDTGTDGTTDDTDKDDDGVIDGIVGEALDDVVSGIADGILDMGGIKTRHNARFGTYTNTDGFTTKIDTDNDTDYKVTYIYDLSKLSDSDISSFGIDRDFESLRSTYISRGLTCK